MMGSNEEYVNASVQYIVNQLEGTELQAQLLKAAQVTCFRNSFINYFMKFLLDRLFKFLVHCDPVHISRILTIYIFPS